jgi:DNA invertase Pin-like site-specific DNA recombinase
LLLGAKRAGRIVGYARVSTEDQDLRLQVDALEKAGCWNIYKEKRSAYRSVPRRELEVALLDLREGDTLIVWKLDRLGRNLRDLFRILDRIHSAGATFKSLTEGIDLTTPMGELMFHVIGAFSQFEAAMTAKRTEAGIAALQSRGFLYGAQPKLTPAKAKALVRMRKRGVTIAELARRFDISTGSVRNYMERAKTKQGKAT